MTFDLDVAIRLLRITTPMWATIAFASMTVGLVTNAWLYSEEKMPNQHFNRTGDPDLEFLSKYTFSGLWSLCFTNRESGNHRNFTSISFNSFRQLVIAVFRQTLMNYRYMFTSYSSFMCEN